MDQWPLSKTSIVETSIPYLFIYFGSDDSHLLIPSATLSTLPSLSLFALDSLNILWDEWNYEVRKKIWNGGNKQYIFYI